ncbi:hypothetical protein [Paenibacillus sp. 8b26]|uniref:hypothetical protein n=1 Tax=Paenibacillus sp. 8b26 TaxID=3424133 RepID=UPI003D646D30
MKKLYGLSFTLILVFALFLIPSASAAPVPHLTSIQIVGITSDGANNVWSNSNLSGTQGVIAVKCIGTILGSPPRPTITQNGVFIPTTQYQPNEYITQGNNVIGTIYYRAFNLSDVSTGSLTASAQDYHAPNKTYTTSINIKVQ